MVHIKRDERGQAVTEYILMLAVIIGFVLIVNSGLKKSAVGSKLILAFTADFAHAYQHGDPKAKGYEDGGPYKHPRAITADASTENFRIFLINKSGGDEGGSN